MYYLFKNHFAHWDFRYLKNSWHFEKMNGPRCSFRKTIATLVRVWRHPSCIHYCCKFPVNHLYHLLLLDFLDVIELIAVNGNTETFQEVVITKHFDHYFCGNKFKFWQSDMKLLLNDMNTFWFISFHSHISKRWVSAHNKYYNNMVKSCVICCIEKATPSYPFVSWQTKCQWTFHCRPSTVRHC